MSASSSTDDSIPVGMDADFEPTEELMKWEKGAVAQKALENSIDPESAYLQYPLQLIYGVIKNHYSNSLELFVTKCGQLGENNRLSQYMQVAFDTKDWKAASQRKYRCAARMIFSTLPLPTGFVDSLRWGIATQSSRTKGHKALGKYASLPENDPTRMLLTQWLETIMTETNNKTDASLTVTLRFFYNVCAPALDLSLKDWPEDPKEHIRTVAGDNLKDLFATIIGTGTDARVKGMRLRIFLVHMIGYSEDELKKLKFPKIPKRSCAQQEDDHDDGSDKHKFSTEDLEKLYDEAMKDPRSHLLYMILLTTGLRIGGVAHILIKNVADIQESSYVAKQYGKTREKGAKFAKFSISSHVRTLLETWLNGRRPADSGPFLFPGRINGTALTEGALRSWCQKLCMDAGVKGPQCHPHAFRHTFAHMMISCGNCIETVSKCLNHKDIAVTQKFYLRESAQEVQARCITPWETTPVLTEAEKRAKALQALPHFLRPKQDTPTTPTNDVDKERKQKRRRILNYSTPDFSA